MAAAGGAECVLFAEANAAPPLGGARDEEILRFGNVSVHVLRALGHTSEHISLLVTDRTRADEPWLALTGHTRMFGDVGRTGLAVTADEGDILLRRLQRLKALSDYWKVLAGELAESVCGQGVSGKPMPTIGLENYHDVTFRIRHEEVFVRAIPEKILPSSPSAAALRAANTELGLV